MPGWLDFFAGRDDVLESLRAQLTPGNGRAAVLCGMGGIGKTQTAIEYIKRNHKNYEIVLWSLADSEASLMSGFAKLAPDLGLPVKNDVPELVRDVKRWLERNQNWLLVLDNVDDLALAKTFIPAHHKGGVLLTSVKGDFSIFGVVNPNKLDVLSEAEAMNFFRSRIGRDFAEKESPELANLAKELGHFPLALEQAAAYLHETGTLITEYLADLKSLGLPVLEKGKATATDYKKTVATTWQAAFEIIERQHPVSAEVLRLSAFLAPDKIPVELFDSYKTFDQWRRTAQSFLKRLFRRKSELVNESTGNELIAPLTRFSLVKINAESQTFNVHQLVQKVTKSQINKNERKEWIKRTVNLISSKFPPPEFKNWSICGRFLPHSRVCNSLILEFELKDRKATGLLSRTGHFLFKQGQLSEAEFLFVQVLKIRRNTLGDEHSSTLTSFNNLALLYQAQSRFGEAEQLFKDVLRVCESNLGTMHKDTAIAYNNLALLYASQRLYEKAEPLFEKALEICKCTLGEMDKIVAQPVNGLAELYRLQKRYAEAKPLYERALGICEHALGEEHPDTATSLNNLAGLYESQGCYAEAEPLYERALGIRERALGGEHPDTATLLNNLAGLYQSQSRYAEAKPLYERALTILRKVLGDDHPNTKTVADNLEALRRKMNGEDTNK